MTQTIACACGQVQLEVEKAPIISVECHCNSCRAAAARLQTLPGAPHFVEANGGTRFAMYRKDRVRFLTGTDRLKEFRLTPTSKTRRVVATCCNTPVFAEFHGGHWLSLYGCLWPSGTLPPLELRTMTSDLADASVLLNDVPNGNHQSFAFYTRLLGAWIAMGFKVPKITFVNGDIHA
jgi:hypothetical protein